MLNDYSGSPNILSLVIKGMIEKGYQAELYTSSTTEGFLSGIEGVVYHRVFYRFTRNKFSTLILFTSVQLRYFFATLKYSGDENIVFYLNTILPFGAALGASLSRKEIIYHIHENPARKNILHKLAISVFLKRTSKAIFVSDYLYNSYKLDSRKKFLVYNSLSPQFVEISEKHKTGFNQNGEILMLCSLKAYKGVRIFLELARELHNHNFTLVLNASLKDIHVFFKHDNIPSNLKLLNAMDNDVHYFYSRSHLVMNLSVPGLCYESFGLTILESMAYGIPVIVPPAGGIAELGQDGFNGYKVDPRDMNCLIERINLIFSSMNNYLRMSENARIASRKYSYPKMIDEIDGIIQ